ncbi:MAG: NUDIX hydrolase, partial [Acaryochloridaceae cyanobacterium SU_2_1]|nr:NUDIX hydrolase [Acaryochloridaceae cyanobacterium SU_2_1]
MALFQEPPEILQPLLFYQSRKFSYAANRLRLPNGSEGDWASVRHPGGAMAVPLTPEGKILC